MSNWHNREVATPNHRQGQAETAGHCWPAVSQVRSVYQLVDWSVNRRFGIDEAETVRFGVTISDLVPNGAAERATTRGRAAEGHAATNECTVRQEQFTTEEIGHGERSGGRTSILPGAVGNLAVVLRSVTDREADHLLIGKRAIGKRQWSSSTTDLRPKAMGPGC